MKGCGVVYPSCLPVLAVSAWRPCPVSGFATTHSIRAGMAMPAAGRMALGMAEKENTVSLQTASRAVGVFLEVLPLRGARQQERGTF